MDTSQDPPYDWLPTPISNRFVLNAETLAIILLIALALVSRFYDLGARTMSHDEINHVVPSYDLYSGNGYRYDPLSHGPLQFHLMALSYFLFGDGDFEARVPVAVFSVATIVIAILAFRRYLGRWGAFLAGVMFLISPYMLFYGRYTRNEAYIVVWGMLTIYSVLRYFERGERWVLYLFTLVNAFHFVDKATAHIFAAAELLFLAAYFIRSLLGREWPDPAQRRLFLLGLMGAVLAATAALGVRAAGGADAATMTVVPVVAAALALVGLGIAAWALISGIGWSGIREQRSFDLLIVLGTLILPLLSAIPIKLLGGDPLNYASGDLTRSAIVIGILGAIGVAIGLWWNREAWLKCAALFYTPFTLLYTTFFTNPVGLAGGFTGALGYWMDQQAVNRGSQPLYFYALVQIPVYEFLPAVGTLMAIAVAWSKRLWESAPGLPFTQFEKSADDPRPVPVAALTIYWSIAMLVAFSIAGEKMPWLTIHIAQPMILAAGWGLGWLVESTDWRSLLAVRWQSILRAATFFVFAALALLTVRTAFRAAYINYNYALEYLVYAHAAGDPKTIFGQIEELSQRTTGGLGMVVAYDNNVRYPYWWYMRHYPNRMDFDVNPTAEIKNAAVIVVSSENQAKVAPILRNNYYSYDYMRMWWPNQDYWSLKWESIDAEYHGELGAEAPPMPPLEYLRRVWGHVSKLVTDPAMRKAVWEIWFNRDYSDYASLEGTGGFSLTDWNPADKMTMYVRQDINRQVWNYGVAAKPIVTVDPYAGVTTALAPDKTLGGLGTAPGQFQAPRGIAVAPDGSLYVADSRNHRIQHLAADGTVLGVWGSFADVSAGSAPGGTFNEPWGVAVAPDGSVYVADTWNHRVQRFNADGKFLAMWSQFGAKDQPDAFYGPRGIAVDGVGHVYVADTGNKRILIFDAQGQLIAQFGGAGVAPGQFDEPVGVALDTGGNLYVADTWNQRVQMLQRDGADNFVPLKQWDVTGWSGNSLDNKPFISVAANGHVFVTDPEICRVLEFNGDGTIVRVWGTCGGDTGFGLFSGAAVDPAGIWVSDAAAGRLLHFVLPSTP